MGSISSLIAVIAVVFVAAIGSSIFKFHFFFGVVVPYTALFVLLAGFLYRIIGWARSPVPFCIPTVCGQEKSLPWIKADNLESPYTTCGIIRRMALEVLFFRSLFRNDRAEVKEGQKLFFNGSRYLWFAGLVFHWSLLVILVRHLKLFIEPVPSCIVFLQNLDGMFEFLSPPFYMTDKLILLALIYLFFRRVIAPKIKYISLPADYFVLLLIAAVVISGILMRYFYKIDIMEVKRFAMGLARFHPVTLNNPGTIFFVHIFLVSSLFAYLPFSKLMHMGGVFLSPTRNLKNDSRMKRHINPWDYPVKVHTYEEWEDDFRDAMKDVGMPVEKEHG